MLASSLRFRFSLFLQRQSATTMCTQFNNICGRVSKFEKTPYAKTKQSDAWDEMLVLNFLSLQSLSILAFWYYSRTSIIREIPNAWELHYIRLYENLSGLKYDLKLACYIANFIILKFVISRFDCTLNFYLYSLFSKH